MKPISMKAPEIMYFLSSCRAMLVREDVYAFRALNILVHSHAFYFKDEIGRREEIRRNS